MENIFEQYKDYYLIKCFEQEDFCSSFNNGNMYINNVSYFHDIENDFQKDKEGIIFMQPNGTEGKLFATNSETSALVSEFMNNKQFEDGLKCLKKYGLNLGTTQQGKLYIDGYLSCFFLIPKKFLIFNEKSIEISPSIVKDFYDFLNSYAKEQGYLYFSIYDAKKLIKTFYEGFINIGYEVAFGTVSYAEITEETKIKWYKDRHLEKIVFTKSNNFDYQHEFRFFITSNKSSGNEPLREKICSIENTVLCSLSYLTPHYLEKIKGITV